MKVADPAEFRKNLVNNINKIVKNDKLSTNI